MQGAGVLLIDQVLQGRYRITNVLGQGGMGTAHRAYDLRLNIACVIKELLITPENRGNLTQVAKQFQKEAETLAGLRHPNIPRVYDYFLEQDNYYIVMDLIEGQSLEHLIGSTGLPEAEVLKYARQLLDVLDYIHGKGVLHRDIKPANIIVQPDGRVVLVDFGLVKVADSNTSSRSMRGLTPHYAPPEQYTGGTDQRSDLFSLAATLYQALTGQMPTSASEQFSGSKLTPLRQLRSTVSANTARVIMKALALDRNDRYQTAAEFASALNVVTTIKVRKSPTLLATLVIVAVVILIAAGAGVLLLGNRPGAIVSSPPPVSTATATVKSAIVLPTRTEIPTPTDIPAATSTATEMPASTDTPSASPTIEATVTLEPSTPAPTSTPKPVQTPLPSITVLPTAASQAPGILFAAPVLVAPASGASFQAPNTPLLSWSSSASLGANDYYFVEIHHTQGVDPYYVKDTAVTPRDYLPGLSQNGSLTWQVTIVRKTGNSYTAISPSSQNWQFYWYPAGQSGGTSGHSNPGPTSPPPTPAPP